MLLYFSPLIHYCAGGVFQPKPDYRMGSNCYTVACSAPLGMHSGRNNKSFHRHRTSDGFGTVAIRTVHPARHSIRVNAAGIRWFSDEQRGGKRYLLALEYRNPLAG